MQKTKNRWLGILLLLLLPFSLNAEEEVVELETYTAEDEIEDDFGVLPSCLLYTSDAADE